MPNFSTRLKIQMPAESDTPVDIPQSWLNAAVILDTLVPIGEGPLSSRPVSTGGTPGVEGRQFIVTDQAGGPRLDLDTGTGWVTVGPAQVDAAPSVASIRTLGTGAQQAAAGNDARFLASAVSSGDISGTLPGPITVNTWNSQSKGQVVAGSPPQAHGSSHVPGGTDAINGLTDASIAAANKDGAAGTPSMRTLGTGSQQALPGNYTPPNLPLVTALPSSPVDGQPCYYVADATNGIIWHLRYNAGWSADSHKWQFIGGDWMSSYTNAISGTASVNTWVGGFFPNITIPALAGVYRVEVKVDLYNPTGGNTSVSLAFDTARSPNVVGYTSQSGGQVFLPNSMTASGVNLGDAVLQASDVLRIAINVTVANTEITNRYLRVRPLRVG